MELRGLHQVFQSDRRARIVAYLVVAGAVALTFARSLTFDLLRSWDDDRFLFAFDAVHGYSWSNFVTIWKDQHFQAYHPLHLLSYWLDVPWAGLDPSVIHLVSIVLWVLAVLAVLAAMRHLGLSPFYAVAAALLFGLHPVQVEVATWATGRKDILAAGFAALALVASMRSERWTDGPAWLARLFYLLAALSKTTALPLPGLLFLADVLLRQVSLRRALLRQLPSLVMGIGLAVVVLFIWDTHQMIRPDAAGNTVLGRILLVCDSITHHLRMAAFPVDNAPIYPIYRTADIPLTALSGPLLLLGGLLIAWRAKAKRALFSLAGFLVLLLPVMNLVPMYWHYTDRYLSLPLLPLAYGFGAAFAFVVGSVRKSSAKRLAQGAACVILLLLALRTVQHQAVYADDRSLWQHTTAVEPKSYYGWLKLGEHWREAGEYEKALSAYRNAIEVAPRLGLGHAARFYTLVLRDEKIHDAAPHAGWDMSWCIDNRPEALDEINLERGDVIEEWTPALEAVRCFQVSQTSAESLRTLASQLVKANYRDGARATLAVSFALDPVSNDRLEKAARVQHAQGNDWLARFYLSQMSRPPFDRSLHALLPGDTDS